MAGEVVVGVAVGVSTKRRAALKRLVLFILFGVGDGAVNLQLLPSSTLLDVGRRRQEDEQGHPSVLLPDAKRM